MSKIVVPQPIIRAPYNALSQSKSTACCTGKTLSPTNTYRIPKSTKITETIPNQSANGCFLILPPFLRVLPSVSSKRSALRLYCCGRFQCETQEREHQEWERDDGGQYPECEHRKRIETGDQVGIVHVKGRPQDHVGP